MAPPGIALCSALLLYVGFPEADAQIKNGLALVDDVAYFYGSIGFQQRDAILEQACIRSNFYYRGKFDIFWNGMLTRPQRMNSFINLQVLQIFLLASIYCKRIYPISTKRMVFKKTFMKALFTI